MILITWNVQWCRGVDGRVDPSRIVAEAKKLADFDVLCLQEIADNFPHPRLAGSAGEDQFARAARRCCPAMRRWEGSRWIIPRRADAGGGSAT